MSEPSSAVARLSAALGDRYTIERELGAGGMATVKWRQVSEGAIRLAGPAARPYLRPDTLARLTRIS
ncbi:MAG TPA: hypothetical protein VIV10_04205 [Gemmatimonadales bacterium]